MILTCPECGTQYVVKDGAIPPGGRQVRCASCKHSWHQDPEPGAEDGAAELASPVAEPSEVEDVTESEPLPRESALDEAAADDDDESLTEATIIDPRSGPEAEERAYEEASRRRRSGSSAPRA